MPGYGEDHTTTRSKLLMSKAHQQQPFNEVVEMSHFHLEFVDARVIAECDWCEK